MTDTPDPAARAPLSADVLAQTRAAMQEIIAAAAHDERVRGSVN